MDIRKKLKGIGSRNIMKNNNLYLLRKKILNRSKKIILDHGWNVDLFNLISKNENIKIEIINTLFPKGKISLLEFFFEEINLEMTKKAKKLNLINMKLHQRIKSIILLKLKNNIKNKALLKKTFFYLCLPKNSKIATVLLFKTVDQMWFLAGDQSTDFNYYSKRAILSTIYSTTLIYWFKNEDFEKTEFFLDDQLKKVSKIPILKKRISDLYSSVPQTINFLKKIVPLGNNIRF